MMKMEMRSSGSAFLCLTSCGARAVLGLLRGDVRVVKLLLVFLTFRLSLPLCECLNTSEVRFLSLPLYYAPWRG